MARDNVTAWARHGLTVQEYLDVVRNQRNRWLPPNGAARAGGCERTVYDTCAYCGRDDFAADNKHGCIGCGAPRRRVPASAGAIHPGQMYPAWRVGPRYFYG